MSQFRALTKHNGSRKLGPELALNGGFDIDANWAKSAGWTISGGFGVATSAAAYTSISQGVLMIGKVYQITYTVSSITSGNVKSMIGGGASPSRTTTGTFTDVVICSASITGGIQAGSLGFSGQIDNVSIKEVLHT